MYNCIFTGHCMTEGICNASCPVLAQTSYLLERNEIKMNNPVFQLSSEALSKYSSILTKSADSVSCYVESKDPTTLAADGITYCAICENWKGSQLHCTVYNLKFSQYIEKVKKSWSFDSEDSDVDYIKIWAQNAKVLIVSNIDFVNFKEFQCQILLSLIQERSTPGLTTIIVSPTISSLVGEGPFFSRLTELLTKQKVTAV